MEILIEPGYGCSELVGTFNNENETPMDLTGAHFYMGLCAQRGMTPEIICTDINDRLFVLENTVSLVLSKADVDSLIQGRKYAFELRVELPNEEPWYPVGASGTISVRIRTPHV